jgi:hypothetical protein
VNERRLGLLAVLAALVVAVAAAGTRLVRRRRAAGGPEARSYTCQCGARYRVTGTDRHRVYWPEEQGTDGEPVLGDRCPQCDASLPGGRETAAV